MSATQAPSGRRLAVQTGAAPGRLIGYAGTGYPGAAEAAGADQERLLEDAGCALVWAEDATGGEDGRPRLRACLASLRPGDVLVVAGLEQLGRTQRALTGVIGEVRQSGAGLRSLREDLDTTAPGGEAIFRVFDGLAGLGRSAISAGTSAGLAAARAQGKRLGRPPALTPKQLREVRELLLRPESTVSGVARQLGVSRSTLYKYLPDARHPGAPAADTAAAAHFAPYLARPGRPVLVIDDLTDLRGPAGGSVELPQRLFWHPNRTFNLDEPGIRRWVYQIVLREATRAADLTGFLNGDVLTALWPDLRLPGGVRRAWEEQHPSLRTPVEV
jgi:DNA invertase Pin-like site-specific DNA recombinase